MSAKSKTTKAKPTKTKKSIQKSKDKFIAREPEQVFEARKELKRKLARPLFTIGVALLIFEIWLVNVWLSSTTGCIIGIVVLCLSVFFILFGFYRRLNVNNLKPITLYEHGIKVPLLDGQAEFSKFEKFPKYTKEVNDGFDTIVIDNYQENIIIVLWPELSELFEKKVRKIE